MKEYKVVDWKPGFTKNNERLEETLNTYAREGWAVIDLATNTHRIVFERDKNR